MKGEQAVYCEACDENTTSFDSTTITTPPPLTVVHLKRFEYDGCDTQKLESRVDISHELQLGRDDAGKPLAKYTLSGIVVHIGACSRGCLHHADPVPLCVQGRRRQDITTRTSASGRVTAEAGGCSMTAAPPNVDWASCPTAVVGTTQPTCCSMSGRKPALVPPCQADAGAEGSPTRGPRATPTPSSSSCTCARPYATSCWG